MSTLTSKIVQTGKDTICHYLLNYKYPLVLFLFWEIFNGVTSGNSPIFGNKISLKLEHILKLSQSVYFEEIKIS